MGAGLYILYWLPALWNGYLEDPKSLLVAGTSRPWTRRTWRSCNHGNVKHIPRLLHHLRGFIYVVHNDPGDPEVAGLGQGKGPHVHLAPGQERDVGYTFKIRRTTPIAARWTG
mgnify:CR=1 FL=1